MHESAPYWFNAMVPLAFQLQDKRLLGQVKEFLDRALDNQQADGWIGPEPFVANATVPRLVWPRYLVLFGMIQYAEADPSQTERIVNAMHRFVALVHEIWATGQQGDPSMGEHFAYQTVRWEELVYSLQWLYDNFPRGKEEELIDTMKMVKAAGFDWKNDWFAEATFPKEAVTNFTMHTHGVNTAEALKSEALVYRFTGDRTDVQNTFDRIDMLYKYHGRASGTYSADEHLAGLDPSRGTETCTVVEQIFSLAVIYQSFGNNSVADRAERLAYNALPSALMPDWKSHQYDQEVNQISSEVLDPPPWGNNGPNANVFGFEPHYPCCTVNHPSAYPKFWTNSFYADQAGKSLIHVFLGPSTFSGKLGTNNNVKVTVDTLYPFGSTLKYTISSTKAFTFKIRVPDWAQSGKSTVSINGGRATPVKLDSSSLQSVTIPANRATVLEMSLDTPVQIEQRSNGAIAIHRGALNYAVDLAFNETTAPGLRSQIALTNVKQLFPNAPAEFVEPFDNHTQDHTLHATVEWRVAIDPHTITVNDASAHTKSMPFYAWAPGAQPVTLTASACQIEWGIVKGVAAPPPQSPVSCVGAPFKVKLAPFGAAKLRIGEMPVMSLS
ncbi:hypothetical protein HGRIS_008485 [Hohenbuehelia grisea]